MKDTKEKRELMKKRAPRNNLKGKAWERRVYKELRELGKCKRTLGSGSSDEAGDIYFGTDIIECKAYKKVSPRMIKKWLDKLVQEMHDKKVNGTPTLIYKANYQTPMVAQRLWDGQKTYMLQTYEEYKENKCQDTN